MTTPTVRTDRLDYGGTTVIHGPDGSWLEVFLPVDAVRNVLTAALGAAADLTDQPEALTEQLDAIRRVHGCCDPLGMPQLDDGAWVWAIDADAMWTLTTAPGVRDDPASASVRGCLLHAMPELGLGRGHDTDLDDQRAASAVAAQLAGNRWGLPNGCP